MIPQEKNAGVIRALRTTFGVAEFEDICRMTKGLSSDLVFRVVVRGKPHLLRIMTRIDERMDPNRIFACMNAAAEADLTPCVRYSNVEDGISITDFVEAVPFSATQALASLPVTLRRLHGLPLFPKAFNYVTAHNLFIWRFRNSSLLPKYEIEEIFARYERICATYPRLDSDIVSCHMDLKPENIVFDGKQVWLVDWQAAFVNDRYFDLAVAANFLVNNDADEFTYLEKYFGQPPNEYQRARFFLMRQVVHVFYATVFWLLGSKSKTIDLSEKAPSFKDFHQQIWGGEVSLADNAWKVVYGRVHWEQLRANMRMSKFDEALRIIADEHAGQNGMLRLLPHSQQLD
jgi:Phosphotransferase enzyme family